MNDLIFRPTDYNLSINEAVLFSRWDKHLEDYIQPCDMLLFKYPKWALLHLQPNLGSNIPLLSMSDYLPEELLLEILARLPVKSLLQYTTVSKRWHSLITNPSFISYHLTKSTASQLHVLTNHNLPFTALGFFDSIDEVCPFGCLKNCHDHGGFEVVGCSHGLVGLTHVTDLTDFVWNPSLRKRVKLPQSKYVLDYGVFPSPLIIGFGFDSRTNDYKFVKGVRYEGIRDVIEVYSMKTRSWKEVSVNWSLGSGFEVSLHPVFVHGTCHWLVGGNRQSSELSILSFDVGKEVFGEVAIPECLMEQKGVVSALLCSPDELLSLVSLVLRPDLEWSVDIWVMKEYGVTESWTKLFAIRDYNLGDNIVKFMKNGELLIVRYGGKLVYYDPRTAQVRDCEKVGGLYSSYLDTFRESLVLMNETLVEE